MDIIKLIEEKAISCAVKYQTLKKVALGYEMYELYKQQFFETSLPRINFYEGAPQADPDKGTVLVCTNAGFFEVVCDPTGPRNVTWFIDGPHLECEVYSQDYFIK